MSSRTTLAQQERCQPPGEAPGRIPDGTMAESRPVPAGPKLDGSAAAIQSRARGSSEPFDADTKEFKLTCDVGGTKGVKDGRAGARREMSDKHSREQPSNKRRAGPSPRRTLFRHVPTFGRSHR
jgi:hypothetical protein